MDQIEVKRISLDFLICCYFGQSQNLGKAAIDRAYEFLKPGGVVGVVDFYIARKFPSERRMRQSFSTRWFWPMWFSFDNLFLSNDILPYLSRKFEEVNLIEREDRLPFCPVFWKKMPRFIFVGRKPKANDDN